MVTAMLREPVATVEGRYHSVRAAQNVPTGVQGRTSR